MKKFKFVIADSSENFALEIQEKLEAKAGGNSEILIITEKNYLDEFFESPQKMDVLLIDKKFYSKAIEKHDIDLICIVSDDKNDCNRLNTGFVYTVHRDSGSEEITRTMLSVINPALIQKKESDSECKIILVTSPLGGSGKTVTAAAIALHLRKSGMKVLFADTTSFQSSSHWITDKKKIGDDEYILDNFNAECVDNITAQGNVDHIAFFSQVLPALDINAGNYYEIIKAEKKREEYDYIVVDSDSCFTTDLVNFMTVADHVVILTLQDEVSVHKMQRFLYSFDCSDTSKYITCCSKFCIDKKNYLSEKAEFMPISVYIPMVNLNGAELSEVSKMPCFNRIASMLL